MARDYDYLFKLLIIGDSGKPTPGMQDGKWALSYFFLQWGKQKYSFNPAMYHPGAFAVYYFVF